jgi:Domain of unknown function (DUF1906)
VTILGVDYAWIHPDPAALAAAGYRFACRYLSLDPAKNLTRAEAETLAAHGISVVANWEYGATDALRGYAGGKTDATLALAQAVATGMPPGRPIYLSADWNVTPAQESVVTAYLKGAESVLGQSETGEYAGYYPIKLTLDDDTAAWTWQTDAWSGGQWNARAQIRQTGTALVGGEQVDVNEAMTADYGQWTPGGTDMEQADPLAGFHTRAITVGDALGDMSTLRDYLYGTTAAPGTNPPAAGSNADLIVKAAALIPGLAAGLAALKAQIAAMASAEGTELTALTASVGQIEIPAVDTAALAAALAGNEAFAQAVGRAAAAALAPAVAQLATDLAKS